jgi:hypothetical protein
MQKMFAKGLAQTGCMVYILVMRSTVGRKEHQMSKFTFYVEGVGIYVEAVAESEKLAHRAAWQSLTDEQKDAAACLDCVDEVAA